MTTNEIAHPRIATYDEWLAERKKLLEDEKASTRERDRIAAARRRLPMVRVEKAYRFQGPNGEASLRDLFEGQIQLIVYHFMFGPDWEKGCPGCTSFVDSLGDLSTLKERNTTFALVSRAPLEKLDAYKKERGWNVAWYSSFGSDFNYDYHATLDESVAPREYNFAPAPGSSSGEAPGLSVFFRLDDDVFHTYSTYARGVESLTDTYPLLDVTPYGRQEDWEDSPAGWPQKPTYG
ncbi:MAG TPA: DUF899 domain-containing protein [Fimbriimonadaceae bacterium]|nr:DUF899 domain-containing protein [Fimbriimonadaceae bacterium]